MTKKTKWNLGGASVLLQVAIDGVNGTEIVGKVISKIDNDIKYELVTDAVVVVEVENTFVNVEVTVVKVVNKYCDEK